MDLSHAVTDEQVFYDKFLCDKFYLLVCTRNFDNFDNKFFYDKWTCSKVSIISFWTNALVIEKIVKVQILFVCMDQQRMKENLSK
jgi:hypothetical protein